ncbi:unnamed protein product [Polarella glacialis]|uniref:3'-5' exonuclease domain-containing protein n=1 Tax=Polarella glacialis TaxID=89957 RepID=A0A813EC15_POLGL|nr:unnamed protein product [Polarella glacialis]
MADELCSALRAYRSVKAGATTATGSPSEQTELLERAVRGAPWKAFHPARRVTADGCIEIVQDLNTLASCTALLRQSSVVGVDVERHQLQSFSGYNCLVQLSTALDGGRVFLVDCIKLPKADVAAALSEILSRSDILKVFHAAQNDVKWLEQDFGIQTSPVLDTQTLTRKLSFPFSKLTDQWSALCNLRVPRALKQRLQLSDWTRRPLAPLQAIYAGADAYQLLPIAGRLLYTLRALDRESEGWGREVREPPPTHYLLADVDADPDCPAWMPDFEVLKSCQIEEGSCLWHELVAVEKASREVVASGGAGAGLRRAARLAPDIAAEHVEALAVWRLRKAEGQDVSPQWLVPDELLLRALAAKSSEEAELALRSTIPRAGPECPEFSGLEGDMEQVASQAHLDDSQQASLLCLLRFAREGLPLGIPGVSDSKAEMPGSKNCHASWWLPFRTAADFQQAVAKLPEIQRERVMQEPLRKRARFLSFIHRVAAKRPVYENCQILAPDGQVLCTVDTKKLHWYVRRGLGKFEPGQEDCIRLLFEPAGRFGIASGDSLGRASGPGYAGGRPSQDSTDGGDRQQQMEQREKFYTSVKENRCVRCGADMHLARYNIVPSCLRSFLPLTHQPGSHDVLLLCVPCHHKASLEHGQRIKEVLASGVGLHLTKPASSSPGDPRNASRMSALGMIKGGDSIPWERVQTVFQRILEIWEDAEALGEGEKEDDESYGEFCAKMERSAPELLLSLRSRWPTSALRVLWRASQWRGDAGGSNSREPLERRRGHGPRWELEAGEKIVQAWTKSGADPSELICRCRVHFLEALKPKFLPAHWDVDHKVAVRSSDLRPGATSNDDQ